MKLWKKVLIVVAVLGVLALGALGYGVFKIGEQAEELESSMQRYVTMTSAEQDQYVLANMEEIFAIIPKSEQVPEWDRFMDALQNDPEIQKAATEWGRSVCAELLLDMESVTKNLSAEDKAKYRQEADVEKERSDRFNALLEKLDKPAEGGKKSSQ